LRLLTVLLFTTISLVAQTKLTGIIKPIYDAKLSVSTEGIITKFYKKEGDFIKKDDFILKLDDNLQKLETQRRKIVLEDKTQLEAMQKNLMILKDILNKKEILFKKTKAISLNELNQLRMQYINTQGEVDNFIANEKKETIEYKISAEVLKYYKLKSPVDGVITKIKPKIGEWVETGKEIVDIVDIRTCFVEIDLNINQLQTIKLNSKVIIKVDIGDKIIKKDGFIKFISVVADNSSSLIRAKVYFDNKDMLITPGINATVIF